MHTSDQPTRPPNILIIGGANTGRSPIAAALLRRMLQQRHREWTVESAGIIGYDGDPPDLEARNVMLVSFAIEISDHCARSLTDELIQNATLLLPVDRGIAHAVAVRYPDVEARLMTLGSLAGRERDIPDPFRMQIGAWISYAREIETLLSEGIERLITLVERLQADRTGETGPTTDTEPLLAADPLAPPDPTSISTETTSSVPEDQPSPISDVSQRDQTGDTAAPVSATAQAESMRERRAHAIDRCERLITLMRDMPNLVAWENARHQLTTEIHAASEPLIAGDLVESYGALLLALLDTRTTSPTPEQLALLHAAIARMRTPIDEQSITSFSAMMAGWSTP